MKKRIIGFAVILIMYSLNTPVMIYSQDISLPSPSRKGGMPLMEALDARVSARLFSDKDLSLQQLSDLLWAAPVVCAVVDSEHSKVFATSRHSSIGRLSFTGLG